MIVIFLNLVLLFDGSEYKDVKEVAKMFVSFADGGIVLYYLIVIGVYIVAWTGEGSVLSLGSGVVDGGTGVWQINNPFGFRSVDSIVFIAVKGYPKSICHICDNQSDYIFMSMVVTSVPEANTSAMIFAGLLMLGGLTVRRMKS